MGVHRSHHVRPDVFGSGNDSAQRKISAAVFVLASLHRASSGRMRPAARSSERPLDGLERPCRVGRRNRIWLTGDRDGGLHRIGMAVGCEATICRASSLDVSLLRAVVLGRRVEIHRRTGNRCRSRIRMGLPRRCLGKLGSAAVGV